MDFLFLFSNCCLCLIDPLSGTVPSVHTPFPLEHSMGSVSVPLSLRSDQVTLAVPEALSSSSVSNLSAAPPTRPVFPDPVEVFYDNVVKSRGVGI